MSAENFLVCWWSKTWRPVNNCLSVPHANTHEGD